jgi:hypothetical protein
LSDRIALPDAAYLTHWQMAVIQRPCDHRHMVKKGTAPRSPYCSWELREKKPKLVAPLRLIGRHGCCRGRLADGQLVFLPTEENFRQRLVTSLVGAGGISIRGSGLL